ncbi:MAG: sensor histidine kinase [Myxococcota bacterium]
MTQSPGQPRRGVRALQRYRALVEQAGVAMLAWRPSSGEVVEANAMAAELCGRSVRRLLRSTLEQLFDPRDRESLHAALAGPRRDGRMRIDGPRLAHPERGAIAVEVLATTVRVQGEELELGVLRDHTEIRALERREALINEELSRNERMASIGQLAAGVAHEINNPMSYVASNVNRLSDFAKQLADLTVDGLERGRDDGRLDTIRELVSELQEIAQETSEGVARVCEIVTALREFSHGGRGSAGYEWVDLNRVIRNCLTLLRRSIADRAEIHLELDPLPQILCHPTQIAQIIANLVTNAAESMEEPGVILITSLASNDKLHIAVEDNGSGIAGEDLPRIFDPFFTTKAVGRGTGLGLSVSQQIAAKHGGALWVDSLEGQGTRFLLELPRRPPTSELDR